MTTSLLGIFNEERKRATCSATYRSGKTASLVDSHVIRGSINNSLTLSLEIYANNVISNLWLHLARSLCTSVAHHLVLITLHVFYVRNELKAVLL